MISAYDAIINHINLNDAIEYSIIDLLFMIGNFIIL